VPLSNGRPASIAGYANGREDGNVIVMLRASDDATRHTVFHEYTHLIVGSALRSIPIWANEGLAEYYATFELSADGRQAVVGGPIATHVVLLRQRFLPLAELLATTASLYDESDRRSIFYAESWALVHFIVSDVPDGKALLSRYLAATS